MVRQDLLPPTSSHREDSPDPMRTSPLSHWHSFISKLRVWRWRSWQQYSRCRSFWTLMCLNSDNSFRVHHTRKIQTRHQWLHMLRLGRLRQTRKSTTARMRSQVYPNPVNTHQPQTTPQDNQPPIANLHDDLFHHRPPRKRLTRHRKWNSRREHGAKDRPQHHHVSLTTSHRSKEQLQKQQHTEGGTILGGRSNTIGKMVSCTATGCHTQLVN